MQTLFSDKNCRQISSINQLLIRLIERLTKLHWQWLHNNLSLKYVLQFSDGDDVSDLN